MALLKYGGGVVQASGSLAGNTYARNRYGNYMRARTKPVNPNTSSQQSIRSAVTQMVARWSNTLTAAQRAAWALYASSVGMLNRLGEAINLSGFNHFIRSAALRSYVGATIVDDGPTEFSLPETDSTLAVTISEAAQKLSITFDTGLAWVNEDDAHMAVFMGQPQGPSINFFNGPWKLAGTIDGDSVTPPTSPDATLDCPFVATDDQKAWIYCRITRADGRVSSKFIASCTVAA